MPRPSRRLLLLPLLLLVPLGSLKWRADHPPVSEADRVLSAALDKAVRVSIHDRTRFGAEVTGGYNSHMTIRDAAVFQEIAQTLRCSDRWVSKVAHCRVDLHIVVSTRDPQTHQTSQAEFDYSTGNGFDGDYLTWDAKRDGTQQEWVEIRPRFAPQFKALLKRLNERAKVPEAHPEVVWEPTPANTITFMQFLQPRT